MRGNYDSRDDICRIKSAGRNGIVYCDVFLRNPIAQRFVRKYFRFDDGAFPAEDFNNSRSFNLAEPSKRKPSLRKLEARGLK